MNNNRLLHRAGQFFKQNIKSFSMILALLLIWILFAAATKGIFLKPQNLSNLFRQMTIIAFLAIGMVLVIVTGNIDLSVGSVTGFVSAAAAVVQVKFLPPLLSQLMPLADQGTIGIVTTICTLVISLLVGALAGVFQGALIAYLGIPAFIVTLGGYLAFRGGVLGITMGKTIVPIEKSTVVLAQGYQSKPMGIIIAIGVIAVLFVLTFRNRRQKKAYGFTLRPLSLDLLQTAFFSGLVLLYVLYVANGYKGLQNPVLLMGAVALIFAYISQNTPFGRYCYALGGNKEATRLSGVNISANVFLVYVLMGLLCGVAGFVLTGYLAAGTTSGGINFELSTIAACVIGGTSLMGGEGSIYGALVGALVMASLENGMSVMNMDNYLQFIIKGGVLVAAVYIDVASKRKSFLV